MKAFGALLVVATLLVLIYSASRTDCAPVLDFHKRMLAGQDVIHLCESYKGHVVLIVNTASKCAFAPQFEGLENLYRDYKDQGLVVLGFPSNDFGHQEPGSEKEIREFCRLTYSVAFPMFEKTHAREGMADPLYEKLAEITGKYPSWNFHKFLVDRSGNVVGSYSSLVAPQSKELIEAIELQL